MGVQCDLAKAGKPRKLFVVVLDRARSKFKDNGSAVSIMDEYWLPFLESLGIEFKPTGLHQETA